MGTGGIKVRLGTERGRDAEEGSASELGPGEPRGRIVDESSW